MKFDEMKTIFENLQFEKKGPPQEKQYVLDGNIMTEYFWENDAIIFRTYEKNGEWCIVLTEAHWEPSND